MSPEACTPDPAEGADELLLDEAPVEAPVDEPPLFDDPPFNESPVDEPPDAGGVLEQEAVVVEDPCSTPGRALDPGLVAPGEAVSFADAVLEPFGDDDPLPQAVNIPARISEPVMINVHERTPVLCIGTPRQTTPFSSATHAAQRHASNGFGTSNAHGIAWSGRPQSGPRLHEIADSIPATPLS